MEMTPYPAPAARPVITAWTKTATRAPVVLTVCESVAEYSSTHVLSPPLRPLRCRLLRAGGVRLGPRLHRHPPPHAESDLSLGVGHAADQAPEVSEAAAPAHP